MSSSLLVEKMKRAALERNIDAEIWAASEAGLKEEADRADVILLGPQVRYKKEELTKGLDMPVDLINMRDYGMMDGDNVLSHALSLIHKTVDE
jgi:PTS system cellobiose-specific IIB component